MTDLDLIYVEWGRISTEKRYKFIKKFKNYLAANPALLVHSSHDLFKEIIEHHIQKMTSEHEHLQDVITKRYDMLTDGYDDIPHFHYESFNWLNEKIADRMAELSDDIAEYKADLQKRQAP